MFRRVLVICLVLTTALPVYAERVSSAKGSDIFLESIAVFDRPWALSFLPDQSMLVTTKRGTMYHVDRTGRHRTVEGVPEVFAGGQGGLGDVVLHPDFRENNWVYFSYVDSNDQGKTKFARVVRAKLTLDNGPRLGEIETIWHQNSALVGQGHYAYRLAFGPMGSDQEGMLFITSGDRQAQLPAQDMSLNLGKIIRLHDDGRLPTDNPFATGSAISQSFWSIGHRNMLGIAFDGEGQLWAHEMGPQDGDELNRIVPGGNYGWPIVSEGIHYNGQDIPNHSTRPEFIAPSIAWVPTVAPSGLIFEGAKAWIGGLRSRALIQVDTSVQPAQEVQRYEWGRRVRDVDIDARGNLWVLEDGRQGRLIKIVREK